MKGLSPTYHNHFTRSQAFTYTPQHARKLRFASYEWALYKNEVQITTTTTHQGRETKFQVSSPESLATRACETTTVPYVNQPIGDAPRHDVASTVHHSSFSDTQVVPTSFEGPGFDVL